MEYIRYIFIFFIVAFFTYMILSIGDLPKEEITLKERQIKLNEKVESYIRSIELANTKSAEYIESLKDLIEKQKDLIRDQNDIILKYKEFCLINFEKDLEKES